MLKPQILQALQVIKRRRYSAVKILGLLKLQHIIRAQHLFLFDSEVDSGDAGVGVIEEFGQLDECKFSLSL